MASTKGEMIVRSVLDPDFNFHEYLIKHADKASNKPFHVVVKDVSLVVSKGRKEKRILDEVSFGIKPGQMTLVLGAPGCGKSTLFNVLANQVKVGRLSGEVLFNGKPANERTHHREVAFVSQEDVHFPMLTIKETFEFSMKCQADKNSSAESRQTRIQLLLKLLDLKHVENTLVGNDLVRGISGGQRKRVTIGVAMMAGPSLMILDEPTTGLDANTSLEVISAIRTVCNVLQVPVIVSLLQPSPEICNLFDNLLILTKGRVAYFGYYKAAVPYFDRLGLRGTMFQSDPEFLQEVVDYSYKYTKPDVPVFGPSELVHYFKESAEGKALAALATNTETPDGTNLFHRNDIQRELYDREKQEAETPSSIQHIPNTYPIPLFRQVWLNIWRELVMRKRDKATVRARIIKKVVLALVAGSLFFQLPTEQKGLTTRQALLFFSLLFLSFSNVGSIVSFYRERAVFYRQREAKYYAPSAYFIAKNVVDIPVVIIECFVYSVILYWLTGLNSDFLKFIYFVAMLTQVDFFSVNLCRLLSCLLPTEQVAAIAAPASYSIFILFAGFIIPPPMIPDWWIWLYHLSPFHYALEGLMINELSDTVFTCTDPELYPPPMHPLANVSYPIGYSGQSVCPMTHGEQELMRLDMHTDVFWKWIHLIILAAATIFLMAVNYYGFAFVYFPERKIRQPPIGKKKSSIQLEVRSPNVSVTHAGVYMSWDNLSYNVGVKEKGERTRKTLLNNITGFVRPGMLLALMGPSGAGKSTLLDVLANRKTGGRMEGTILVNGKPRDKFFNRFTGYVEQSNILMPLATVHETIAFAAETRLSGKTKEQKMAKVESIIGLLDLDECRKQLCQNLSMEQKKRVTIGVELAADPCLLFLDEPTSGLDSQAAAKVMDVVRRIAQTGRAVICTIHQPSSSIFSYFDHLLLLRKGGNTVYFGPLSEDCKFLFDYFAQSGWQCAPKRNPADFILDIANATTRPVADDSGNIDYDPAAEYEVSHLKMEMDAQLCVVPTGFQTPVFHGVYSATVWVQLACNIKRAALSISRRRSEIKSRLLRSLLVAILLSTSFLFMPNDQSGATNRFAVVFFTLVNAATAGGAVIPSVVQERAVFYREQASGSYRTFTYLIGITLAEVPMTIATTIVFAVPVYWLTGLRSDGTAFSYFILIFFLYGQLSLSWAHLIGMLMPNGEMAQALSGLFMAVFSLFAGFMLPKPQLPSYWKWMMYVSFMHYPLEALITNELHDMTFTCPAGTAVPIPINQTTFKDFCPITAGDTLLKMLDMNPDNRDRNPGIMAVICVVVMVGCYLSLRFVRHIKR
eukprot:Phypoly_transcript_00680.p1 GENE.Phypoly_transcript_00680~~Phypoly_transcript_00680.p1  ORF type:complete len:1306 (+),score=176.26 Phypoly_transcript_00680:244-4161(+)